MMGQAFLTQEQIKGLINIPMIPVKKVQIEWMLTFLRQILS
jgi:hypothetical protein